MIQKVFKNAKSNVVLLASALVMSSLVLTGCGSGGGGSDSYDKPATSETAPVNGAATQVLVDVDTLASWVKTGQAAPAAAAFDERILILDFGPYTMDPAKDPERIKGACRVPNGDLNSRRVEGVATAYPMVATGAQMDGLIQRLGIDEKTTIVFTTGSKMFYSTRAYWMFRYWGFPQEKLKVLNGGNIAFAAKYGEGSADDLMTREVPVPTPSEYSVSDVSDDIDEELRLSISEMLGLVANIDSETDVLLDARGPGVADASAPSNYFGTKSSTGYVTGNVDYVVYDGHPQGGQYLAWSDLYKADQTFKSKDDIEDLFEAKGWTKDKMTTVYCLSGYSATPLYFAVEAILGGKARLYDGSWSQFGQYSDFEDKDGELPEGSLWASDFYLAADEGYRYNKDHLSDRTAKLTVETLKLDEDAIEAFPSPFDGADAVPSQVETADAAYVGDGDALAFPAQDGSIPAGVVISAAELKTLIDADPSLVNAPLGSERVVILDATSNYNYIHSTHIPGAQLWDIAEHVETRVEGPAPTVNMVLSGEKMDDMLQKHGIDEYTTIVITSDEGANYYPSRAYFLLRYYGFPKERIKVLDGYNTAWNTAYPADVSTTPPALITSDLTVEKIANLQPDSRVALSELMDATRDGRGVAVDFRGAPEKAGVTEGVWPERNKLTDYTVFDGRVKGGTALSWKLFSNANATFKSAADIEDLLAEALDPMLDPADVNTLPAAYRDGDMTDGVVYSYCRTGYVASSGFFFLDAILGIDVMTYDGSWSQWGKMSANADQGGELPAGSLWATDNTTYVNEVFYNKGVDKAYTPKIESLKPVQGLIDMDLEPGDVDANQIETEDSDYKNPSAGGAVSAPQPFTPAGGGC